MTLRILVSFPYLTAGITTLLANTPDCEVLIDSGAYTAHQSGVPISLEDYVGRLGRLAFTPWRYLSLDVIGDAQASLQNYRTMGEAGLDPVPVLQRGASFRDLHIAYAGASLVALGGLVGKQGSLGYVKKIAREAPGRNIHWLGFAPIRAIGALCPYSVDTATCFSGSSRGRMAFYAGGGKWLDLYRETFLREPSDQIKNRFTEWGLDWRRLGVGEEWRHLATRDTLLIQVPMAGCLTYGEELFQKFNTRYFISGLTTAHKIGQLIRMREHLCKR